MKNSMERILYDTAVLTFEALGFLSPTAALNASQRQALVDTGMQVEFHGPLSGQLAILICGDILPVLAANMVGEESPTSIPFQRDALGEITNVLCGNMLPLLSNTKAEFHLQTPTIISDDKIAQVSRGATVSVQVGLDDYGRADVFLRMN